MTQIGNRSRTISIQVFGVLSLFVLGSIAACQPQSPANTGRSGMIIECELLGGTVVTQPPGFPITACCYENGCWICDEAGNDCVFDPVYAAPFWDEVFSRPTVEN